MDSICIGAVPGGGNSHIGNLDAGAIVKLEVGLGTVLNCDASDCYIRTPIEPESLHMRVITRTKFLILRFCFSVVGCVG